MPSFLYPSKGGRALRARGKQRRRRCTNATPIFFPEKENGRRPSKRKAFPIASEQLEELQCLPIALPIARRCRVSTARRFASAPTIRCCAAVGGSAALRMRHTPCGCRSAHLVEVQPNFRLPPVSTMRRASAMPLFRTQSAAGGTSHAPHDSKARLLSDHDSQGFMAKPCTPHPHCAARAALQAPGRQCWGSRGPPLAFSWGSKGVILSRERMTPFPASPARCRGTYCPRQRRRTYFSSAALILASSSSSSWRYATLPTRVLGISSLNSMSYGMAYFATFLRQ